MKKHVRFASALLALTMMGQAYVPMCAQAAEAVPEQSIKNEAMAITNKEVGAITITGIDKPQLGEVLPLSARVVADNGATWKIPVVWVDANGNICKIATKDTKAYPVFAFYLPKEYQLKAEAKDGVKVNLPGFINQLFDGAKLLFINDTSTGLSYITGANGAGKNLTAEQVTSVDAFVRQTAQVGQNIQNTQQKEATTKQAPAKNVTPQATPAAEITEETTSETTTETTEEATQTQETPQEAPVAQPEQAPENVDLVAMHCDKTAIEKMGYDKLAALTQLVRYTIQPQAVNMLVDNFKCYSEAVENNELGKDIGLYIYYDDAMSPSWDGKRGEYRFDNPAYQDEKDAVAYVSMVPIPAGENTRYDEETGQEKTTVYYTGAAKYIVAVNASGLDKAFYQDEDGFWKLEDYKRAELNNTLTHEMMHGFMDDYTRPGMEGAFYDYDNKYLNYGKQDQLHFPGWFIEGTATCVDNPYQYWNGEFKDYYGYDKTLNEDGKEKGYSKDMLKEYYSDSKNIMQLKDCDAVVNRRSSYCSGYLACLYLAKLVTNTDEYRLKYGIKNRAMYEYYDNDGERYDVIDSEVFKQGLDIILKEMHGAINPDDETKWDCTSLDEIIRKISPKDANGERIYNNVEDFTNKFIKEDDNSAQFCANVLGYLEYFSKDDEIANGSVLTPFDNTAETLLKDEATEGKAYVIKDTTETPGLNFVESTVDPYDAYLPAGGCNPWEETPESEQTQEEQPQDDQTEGEQPAEEPAA